MNIIAEHISDEADYRIYIRDLTMKKGSISSVARDPEAQSVYEMYYDFEEPVKKLAGHRILALNRGEKEKYRQDEKGLVTTAAVSLEHYTACCQLNYGQKNY